MPASRRHIVHDDHDAVIRFIEVILAPLKPQERAEWARRHLPKTSSMALTRRDFEVMSR